MDELLLNAKKDWPQLNWVQHFDFLKAELTILELVVYVYEGNRVRLAHRKRYDSIKEFKTVTDCKNYVRHQAEDLIITTC